MPRKLRVEYPRAIYLQGADRDGSGNGYLRTVCDYVHLNPVRAQTSDGYDQPLRTYA